jgi:hypothetical protein
MIQYIQERGSCSADNPVGLVIEMEGINRFQIC